MSSRLTRVVVMLAIATTVWLTAAATVSAVDRAAGRSEIGVRSATFTGSPTCVSSVSCGGGGAASAVFVFTSVTRTPARITPARPSVPRPAAVGLADHLPGGVTPDLDHPPQAS